MRKLYLITILSTLFLSSVCNAQKQRKNRHTVFVGPTLMPPLQMKGFEDFDISDWQEYGLKAQDSLSAEGRVRVPMQGRVNPGFTYGITAVYTYSLNKSFSATAILPFSFSKNVFRLSLLPGITFHFLNKSGLIFTDDAFKIGLSPAVGIDLISVGFGRIKQISGYTSPVKIRQGTFNDGDRQQVNANGLAYQIGLSFQYEATQKLRFLLQPGYGGAAFSEPYINLYPKEASSNSSNNSNKESDAITIDINDAAIVKPDLSSTQANVKPEISSKGFYATIAIGFSF